MLEHARLFSLLRSSVALLSVAVTSTACGGSSSTTATDTTPEPSSSSTASSDDDTDAASDEFVLSGSEDAESAHGDRPSEITATPTETAMRLFIVDPETGPIPGIVVKLTGPDGVSYYTEETDSVGYCEVLVPAGARYDLEYLSLGRRAASAHVDVPDEPNQDLRLTLRYRRHRSPPAAPPPAGAPPAEPEPEHLVLEGILFESGSATLEAESGPRLDRVVEYMTHRPTVRLIIGGHTDNVGDPARNQRLSQERADAVRDYLVAHGIDAGRLESVGFGDTMPVASNDTEAGRAQNRRIEAIEL